jgi:hypothetical protein
LTLIVGIKCQDGVVVGADGAATYSTTLSQIRTITQPTSKLTIVGEEIILGVSGPVGLEQSFRYEIEALVKNTGGRCSWKAMAKARNELSQALWTHAATAWERSNRVAGTIGQPAAIDALHQSVVAFPLEREPCLVQFDHQCQPEEATPNLPFLWVGSGQPTADPFLAFIRRIFRPYNLPLLEDGIFAAVWALDYSIKAQPGGIAEPIQIATLRKESGGKWKARELSVADLGEHREMVKDLEESLLDSVKRIFSERPSQPIPPKSS